MVARDVEMLGRKLHELDERAFDELGLAAVAFGLALAATQLQQDLAIPLLVGALVLTAFGLVAFVKKRLLIEDVAGDRDAYAIDDVRSYALRLTSRDQRRVQAAQIRRMLAVPSPRGNRAQLRRIMRKLERDDLVLDPVCAVVLEQFLHDPTSPVDDVRSHLTQVEAGFRSARVRP